MNEDFSSLSIIEPDDQPRATENIDSIIRLIEILIKKGHAYVGESDVYFSAESFEDYGKLSKRKIEDMLSGARIDINLDKKNPVDFVLWKKDTAGMKWDSPWGPGRPGWHIECSAMSMDALGETFDIHGGGSDLKFPHHENEIAQSECVTGKEFAKILMHTGSLRIDKEKMSKSLKNFITIKDALKVNSAEVLRFFLISSHYRSPLNYSEELLKEAKSSLDRIYNSLDGLNLDSESANRSGYSKTFTDAMDDDFNTPAAIAILFEMTREINYLKRDEEIEKANNLGSELKMLSQSLGILQKNPADYFKSGVDLTDKEIENLIDQRSTARQNRDFALSDSIRDSLLEKAIILED